MLGHGQRMGGLKTFWMHILVMGQASLSKLHRSYLGRRDVNHGPEHYCVALVSLPIGEQNHMDVGMSVAALALHCPTLSFS